MKNFKGCLLMLFMISAFATTVSAQKKNKKATRDSIQAVAIEKLINSKKYTFTAEYASPAQGGTINLTKYFYLEISPDAINSNLPFYGNTNTGGFTDSNIKISSTKFDYSASKSEPGHWYVSIVPKDSPAEKELVLDITNEGTATLMVISANRARMSYTGIIEEK